MRADTAPDFRRLFQSVPGCSLVLGPDLTIVAVTEAYLRATMTRRDDILGRGLFDVFPDNPDDPGATGVANLRASIERVIAEEWPDTMAVQKYDIRRPESEGGRFEERYWSPANFPVLNDDGRVAYIIHYVEDVTELVRLKRQESEHHRSLRELAARSAERHEQLLDTAPDAMVVVEDDGRIVLVNIQTERLFGYARAELIGQPMEVLIPQRFRRAHAVHMHRFFALPAARAMGAGAELFGRRKDGTEIPVEVSLSPLRTDHGIMVSAAIRDISERKRQEGIAKRAAERLASAVESIEEAFAIFDNDDRLVLCNSVYRRLFVESFPGPLVGRAYVELLDAWIDDIDFPDAAARLRFREDRLAHRRFDDTTAFDVRMRDGRRLRVIDRPTAEGGIVKTIWDLTEDVRMAEDLSRARAAAEAGNAAKSEFLSSMSHELRTPLNAILGFAQLLRRDKKEPLSGRHQERVGQILKGGEHLLRLIDDILDLSRIEAGGVSVSTEPVSMVDALEEVSRTLEPMAAEQGIRIEFEALPADVPMIAVDRTRFVQIVMNFASNAIKYNRPAGKVSFAVSTAGSGRVRVTVRDTGMGIPANKQEKLFQPFQRAGQETGPIQGTGIGLVITKRLAELMGGNVGFHSVAGEGSEFWVEMPTHSSGARSIAPPSLSDASSPHLAPEERRRVLYVEDNPANVAFMKDMVSAFENVDLLTAPTAEMGIELARAHPPDVIVMDIHLPGMSGLDALRTLQTIAETKNIPVIALTASASALDKQRGRQSGFYRYLTKPLKVGEFVKVFEALFAASVVQGRIECGE